MLIENRLYKHENRKNNFAGRCPARRAPGPCGALCPRPRWGVASLTDPYFSPGTWFCCTLAEHDSTAMTLYRLHTALTRHGPRHAPRCTHQPAARRTHISVFTVTTATEPRSLTVTLTLTLLSPHCSAGARGTTSQQVTTPDSPTPGPWFWVP